MKDDERLARESRRFAEAEFDRHASGYDEMHAASIRASGERPEYFAVYKQKVLERLLGRLDAPILDFGCGIGNLTRLLESSFDQVHGYDPSSASVGIARERAGRAIFFEDEAAIPDGYGAIVLANVLHHVPRLDRRDLVSKLATKLRPGGKLVVFEHNPLNPLTLKAVRDCPFDEGVELLYPWEVEELLSVARLGARELDYIVFFPKALERLRPLERFLARVPIGAQVCAWGER
jgi:SAM-dependent methyltransferase